MIHFGCDIFEFQNWTFVFNYKSNGNDIEKSIRIGEDLVMDGEIIDICLDDCPDLSACILKLSKHVIKDNDGDVFVKFIDEGGETLTHINSATHLNKDLNFSEEAEDWLLTLSTRDGGDQVTRYNFADVPEKDIKMIKEMIKCEDGWALSNYIWDSESFRVLETLSLYDPSTIGFDVCDADGNEVAAGSIHICPENIHDYQQDWPTDPMIDEENPSKYVLIRTDVMEDTYATFCVPQNFNPGDIHFIASFPSNKVLSWNQFGDEMVTLQGIKYHGVFYRYDDYGDNGPVGETHYCLLEWDTKTGRYKKRNSF